MAATTSFDVGCVANGRNLGRRLDSAQLLDEAYPIAQRVETGKQGLVHCDRHEPAVFIDGNVLALPAPPLDQVDGEADGIGAVGIKMDVGEESVGHHIVEPRAGARE